jgi:hypothetical protein
LTASTKSSFFSFFTGAFAAGASGRVAYHAPPSVASTASAINVP